MHVCSSIPHNPCRYRKRQGSIWGMALKDFYNPFFKFGFGSTMKRMVRILRSTVMVRVGGGWEELDEFLTKHDPCRAAVRIFCTLDWEFIGTDECEFEKDQYSSRRRWYHEGVPDKGYANPPTKKQWRGRSRIPRQTWANYQGKAKFPIDKFHFRSVKRLKKVCRCSENRPSHLETVPTRQKLVLGKTVMPVALLGVILPYN